MKFMYKCKGAISIFLVIILVPMLTISAIFVDLSRVKLGQSAANSAGDLALNTALTNYDSVLKDMYGLFATAQDNDDLMESLEDYYRKAIVSTGISAGDAESTVDKIMSQLGTVAKKDDTSDLLQMDLVDFEATDVPNANLANPTILKKEIVDFMKYRAPINTGLSFITSLKGFTNLSKQTDLVDKKQQYYKEQQSAMEAAKTAWTNINSYNATYVVDKTNFFDEMQKRCNAYPGKYKTIQAKIIKDLYPMKDCDKSKYCDVKNYNIKKIKNTVNTDIETIIFYKDAEKKSSLKKLDEYKKYNTTTLPTADEAKELLNAFNAAYENYVKARNDYNINLFDEKISHPVQYMVQIKAIKYPIFCESAVKVYNSFNELKHAMDFASDDVKALLDETETTHSNTYYEKCRSNFGNFIGTFDKDMGAINNNVNTAIKKFIPLTDKTSTKNDINTIHSQYASDLETLTDAKTFLEATVTSLNAVNEKIKAGGTLDTKKGEWSKSVDAIKDDSLAKSDAAEIKNIGEQFKQDDVKKLIERCNGILSGIKPLLEELKKFKYLGSTLDNCTDFDVVTGLIEKKYGKDNLKNVPIDNVGLDKQVETWWTGSFVSGDPKIGWTNDSGQQPNMRLIQKPNFYNFLYSHFHASAYDPKVTEETNKLAEPNKDIKENTVADKITDDANANDTEKSTTTPPGDISAQGNIPSKSKGDSPETPSASVKEEKEGEKTISKDSAANKASGSLAGMFSQLADELKNIGIALRDDLYMADYMMSMFSYDTYEAEIKYNSLSKNDKNEYTKIKGLQLNDAHKAQMKTLTGEPISPENNFAYGGEVEYILYGGNDAQNKLKSYASIFAIRLGFNLVYAFSTGEIRNGALSIATPISAATLGIVPVPLIQAAIIIGISIAESSLDLTYLRAGMAVPLYKNKETWQLSFSNLTDKLLGVATSAIATATNKVIDKTTESIESWLDKTDEELNSVLEEDTDAFTNSIEVTFDTMITTQIDTVMSKVTSLIDIAKEEGIKGEAKVVEYVNKQLDSWLNEPTDDKNSLAYNVKSETVKLMKAENGKFINQVFASLNASVAGATTAAANKVEEASVTLNKELGKIRDEITNAISTGSQKVADYKTKMMGKIKESVSKGAGNLKASITDGLDGIFGKKTGTIPDSTGVSSLLSFQYSDYLRLFLIVGLIPNQDALLLRTADVIQVNIAKQTNKPDYLLSKSAVYVKINATVQVKPTLLALPLFSKVENNPKNNEAWYEFKYNGIRGY